MFKKDIYEQIIHIDPDGDKYYVIDNGYKVWLFPAQNMKTGYGVFQVSSYKGQLVKKVFPYIRFSRIARKLFKCKVLKLKLSDDIKEIIEKYNNGSFNWSAYYGNLDCKENNKITFQIFNGKNTNYFVKVSKEEVVKQLFEKEIESLELLNSKGIKYIPTFGRVEKTEEWSLYIHNTVDEKIKTSFVMNPKYMKLLNDIADNTSKKMYLEDTEYYEYVDYLKSIIEEDKKIADIECIKEAIDVIEKWGKEERIFTYAHGDFTPWNTYEIADGAYLFDFEYCIKEAIPYIDYFHFICQENMVMESKNIKKCMKTYNRDKMAIKKFVEPQIAFIGYLLFIIAFYYKRNADDFNYSSKQFLYRIKLLEMVLKETN